jgi:hypothetical protein
MVRFDARYLFNSIAAVALVAGPSVARGQDVKRHAFEVPAQDLGASLQALALQSGITVLVDSKIVAGKQAPALHGSYTVEEALRILLDQSGLVYTPVDGGFAVRHARTGGGSSSTSDGQESSSREAGCVGPRLLRQSSGSVRTRSAIPARLGWATLSAVSRKASEADRTPGSA